MSTPMSPCCSMMVMCVVWEFVFIVTVMDTDIYYTKQTLEQHYNNGMCVYRIGSLGALCASSVYPSGIKVSVRMLSWYNVPWKGSHTGGNKQSTGKWCYVNGNQTWLPWMSNIVGVSCAWSHKAWAYQERVKVSSHSHQPSPIMRLKLFRSQPEVSQLTY